MTEQHDKQAKNLRVELTSTAFLGSNGMKNLEECQQACLKHGFEFGVQLHNTIEAPQLVELSKLDVPFSMHAPLLSDYGLNLAASDAEQSFAQLRRDAQKCRELGITAVVFHGFLMTDKPIVSYGHGRGYDECMVAAFRKELSLDGESRLNCDFTQLPEYKERLLRVKGRLAELREQYPDITWCIENDFPAYGSANLLAQNSADLANPICLDSSHLWATCFIFDRDFAAETEAFLQKSDVKMVHLHASRYTAEMPKTIWDDGHLPLTTPNEMNLPRFVSQCRKYGVEHIVLEVKCGTAEDINRLAEMWKA